jgi:hypothetical protein
MGFLSIETWIKYVKDHPEKQLKSNRPIAWRTYSHAFFNNTHECPNRAQWRELLLSPPKSPFLFCITSTGQKNILFKSKISYSRSHFFVQYDDETLLINHQIFRDVFFIFEELYHAGFSKDEIISGNYHQVNIRKAGLRIWRGLEARIKPFRILYKSELLLSCFCAKKLEIPTIIKEETDNKIIINEEEKLCNTDSTQTKIYQQQPLF